MIDYAQFLQVNGLKATFQRITILKTVEQHGHISIDEIYADVIKLHPSLSLATVYKNIILMVENGVLIEVPISGQKSKYELLKEEHIHLVCTQCGEVEDSPNQGKVNTLFNTLATQEHFILNKQQINLYGICKHCAEEVA
ncbi:MAG: hypothetical protein RL113_272 [Pseudomonadota bacterium]|jgi:Fur family ferric uptake transcriptional regulator/Fur family peroxide stress response transcriptional regulator